MNPYDEQQVLAFVDDVFEALDSVHISPDKGTAIWLGRMQFDAVTMGYPAARAKHLAALCATLGIQENKPPVVDPDPPQPDPRLSPREQFFAWVDGKPFSQQTLLDLEPTMKAAGWELTPPNANGDRTKVYPPGGPWIRVGLGEGQWIWLPQAER